MRPGMIIELDKCIGCQACVAACKERWDSGPGAARSWVLELEHGKRGGDLGITFYPGLCNQCADHPCTTECPTGATFANAQGVVVVDPELCIGCGNCIARCPYGARHADPRKGIVEKCNFCAPYVQRGEQPACVATCLADCRHFGDLDDPASGLSELIRARGAEPLTTAAVQVGPKVYYAPADQRERLLAHNMVGQIRSTGLTHIWRRYTRPVARYGVPALALLTGLGGVLANLISRRERLARENRDPEPPLPRHGRGMISRRERLAHEDRDPEPPLPRHGRGMRLLHWFNLASWVVLLLTGTCLMLSPAFALFGTRLPRLVADALGGPAALLRLHVLWGLVWAAAIVPLFLYYKRGGRDALRELLPTRDDLRWIVRKPLQMFGLGGRALPPQDKYNAGQKAFAASALVGTTVIIASGLMMTFHLGSPGVIRAAIVAHKLAILLALVGLNVHVTMAAIIADERPALKSMFSGHVARHHAESHCRKWVEEIHNEPG